MTSKEFIIKEIQRTTEENNGTPLGQDRFEKETGINPYDWSGYWARFGDAQKEAGFVPNQLQAAYPKSFFLDKLVSLIPQWNKLPTLSELHLAGKQDSTLPSKRTFQRFFQSIGGKDELVAEILEHIKNKDGFEAVLKVCKEATKGVKSLKPVDTETNTAVGEVYLFKSGAYYKIGKTKNTVQRGKEIRIQLPEQLNLIHSIKTDDPSGVENYWHKRFTSKRKNGEWFDLTTSDIKAFKRWRKIF